MKPVIRHRAVLGIALLVLLTLPAAAQAVRQDLLVSADWVQRRLGNVTVLHVGDRAGYEAGHIPTAVLVETSSLLVDHATTPNELPPVATLESLFRAAGVGLRERIVVYGLAPLPAARAWFTLAYLGQGHRVALLDGGFSKWVAGGYPSSTAPVVALPGAFEARVTPQVVTRLATMRELVRLEDQLGPNLVLIDARPATEFSGREAGADVPRAGHIPGAANIPIAVNFAPDGTFRPADELRNLYRHAGVSRESANIAYCRTGMQASVSFFVLSYLGYDASLYDGSFVEWSNAADTIVVKEAGVATLCGLR